VIVVSSVSRRPKRLAWARASPAHGDTIDPRKERIVTNNPAEARLSRAREQVVEAMPWGHLEWCVSAKVGSSDTLRIGTCFIDKGDHNGHRYHPTVSDAVRRVVKGASCTARQSMSTVLTDALADQLP
jgi:hypothetical protein